MTWSLLQGIKIQVEGTVFDGARYFPHKVYEYFSYGEVTRSSTKTLAGSFHYAMSITLGVVLPRKAVASSGRKSHFSGDEEKGCSSEEQES